MTNGILVDWEIEELCRQGMVTPYDPALLNPASLDVRVGSRLILAKSDGDEEIDISGFDPVLPFWFHPGSWCLTESLEVFSLPENICATFALKSSRAREGYQHKLAGWCDPGWHGSVLTLELTAAHPYRPLPIYPGLKIGQMIFFSYKNAP